MRQRSRESRNSSEPSAVLLRWTRVDLSPRASLPHGSTTSVPEPHLFGPLSTSLVDKVVPS